MIEYSDSFGVQQQAEKVSLLLLLLLFLAQPIWSQEPGLPAVLPEGTDAISADGDSEHRFGEDLLGNSGFEEGLSGWVMTSTGEPAILEIAGGAKEGLQALRIRNKGGWSNLCHEQRIVREAAVYELDFWVRAGEDVLDGEGNPVASRVSVTSYVYGNKHFPEPLICAWEEEALRPKPVGPQWEHKVARFWTEPVTFLKHFVISIGIQGDVIIDDVSLRRLVSELHIRSDREMRHIHHTEGHDTSHSNRIEESRLVTPHVPFCRPSVSGPIKTLFFVPLQGSGATRDVVELAQRFDLSISNFNTRFPGGFSWDDIPSYGAFQDVDRAAKTAEALERLGNSLEDMPEVLVLGSMNYAMLPAPVQNRILTRVKDGMGLVMISFTQSLPAEFQSKLAEGARERILTGVPLHGLDEFFPRENLPASERAVQAVNAYELGMGRVVAIKWQMYKVRDGGGIAPTPAQKPLTGKEFDYDYLGQYRDLDFPQWTRQYGHRYNYHLSLAAKAIQWAARKSPRARWSRLPKDGTLFAHSELPRNDLPVEVDWDGSISQSARLVATVRDPLGDVEVVEEQSRMLSTGKNEFTVSLPRLKQGLHFLELSLSSEDGIENWAAIAFEVRGPEQIVRVTTKKEHYERGELIHGTVGFMSGIEPAQLVVSLRDTYGRVYNQVSSEVTAGENGGTSFEIEVDRPKSIASYLEVELLRDGEVLSFGDTIVFVPKRDSKEFLSVLWWMTWNEGNPGQIALKQARDAGFNAVYHWAYSPGVFENAAMADMLPTIYAARLTLRPDERGWGMGNVGFGRGDPEYEKWKKEIFVSELNSIIPLGPPFYSLGDENHFVPGFGYSPYELELYREFLARRYGSIDLLNDVYGSEYSSFQDVPRYRESDAISEGLLPALLDHRIGMDDEWATYHHSLADEVKKYDPDARVGAEGSLPGDVERMVEGLEYWAPYSATKRDNVLKRSMMNRDQLTSHWWGGVGDGATDASVLWLWLMRGFANFNQWFCDQHVDGALFNADYSYRQFFDDLVPEIREIMAGPALLLRDARVVSDGDVAIHYSRESEHADTFLTGLAKRREAENGVLHVLHGKSQDYHFISSKQIARGNLQSSRPKILFLPSTYLLSQKVADEIRLFVEAGGMVVADFLPPLDEFGRRLPRGRLDTLFGATCAGTSTNVPLPAVSVRMPFGSRTPALVMEENITDAALRVTDGNALAQGKDKTLVVTRKHGRGKTVLLNFDLSRCSWANSNEIVNSLLESAGVKPEYRLDGPPASEISVLQRGETTLVGVVLPLWDPLKPIQKALVSWDKPMHVYNVRNGQYVGQRNKVQIPVSQGGGQREHLFAMQTRRLLGLEMESSLENARGKTLSIVVEAIFDRKESADIDRLVRIDVVDPAGEELRHYRDFLLLTGPEGEVDIPFAFSDIPGEWTITATDIATGVRSTKAVKLF